MHRHTRRSFLKHTAVAGGAMTLGRLALGAEGAPAGAAAAPADPAQPLQLAIARWSGEAVPEEQVDMAAAKMTEQAIAALGGMQRFVRRGDVVWVKPNIAWNRKPEQAANTNPAVVATLVRLCLDAGAKTVKVGDHPCNDPKQTYVNSGIEAAVQAAGGQVVYLDGNRFRDVDVNGEQLKTWPVYPEIIESDLVINVPIAKHHGLSTATLCMKNYMGVVGGSRGKWHQDISACLCDITAYMKPRLCVLDAVRILTGNGPVGGNLADVKRMDTVAAGTDIVALDAFGAELMGHEKGAIGAVVAAEKAGLGKMDYRSLALREIAVS